jgi:hypothetical protein
MPEPQKIVTCDKCGNRLAIPPEYANTPGTCPKCGGIVNQPKPARAEKTPGLPPLERTTPGVGTSPPPGGGVAPSGPPSPISSLLDSDLGGDIKPISLESDGTGIELPGLDALEEGGTGVSLSGLGALEDDGSAPGVGAVDPLGGAPAAPPITKDAPTLKPEKTPPREIAFSVLVWSVGAGIVFAAGMTGIAFASVTFLGEDPGASGHMTSTLYNAAAIGLVFGLLVGITWGIVRATNLSLLPATGLGAVIGLALSVSYHVIHPLVTKVPSDTTLLVMAAIGAGAGAACGLASVRFKEYVEERG